MKIRLTAKQEKILYILHADKSRWLDATDYGRKSINALLERGLVETSYPRNTCHMRLTEKGIRFTEEMVARKEVPISFVKLAYWKVAQMREGKGGEAYWVEVSQRWEDMLNILHIGEIYEEYQ